MGGHGANRPVKKRKPREQTDKVVKYMGTWEVRRLEEDKLRKIQEKLDNIEKTIVYRQPYENIQPIAVKKMTHKMMKFRSTFQKSVLKSLKQYKKTYSSKNNDDDNDNNNSSSNNNTRVKKNTKRKKYNSNNSFDKTDMVNGLSLLGLNKINDIADTFFQTCNEKNVSIGNKNQLLVPFSAIQYLEPPPDVSNSYKNRDSNVLRKLKKSPKIGRNDATRLRVDLANQDINKSLNPNLETEGEAGEKVCAFLQAAKFVGVKDGDRGASLKSDEQKEHDKYINSLQKVIVLKAREVFKQKFFMDGKAGVVMDLFMKYDFDNSHALDKYEFSNALKALKIDLTEDEIEALIKAFDDDDSGEIEYREFYKAMVKEAKDEGKTNLHEYKMELTFGEATYARETRRLKKLKRDQAREMFRPVDREHAALALHLALKTKRISNAKLVDFFLKNDTDGSGDLDIEEFKTAVNKDLKLGLGEQHLDALIDLLDHNHDGEVSYNELTDILKPRIRSKPVKVRLTDEQINSYPYIRQRTWYGPKFHSLINLKANGESRRSYASLPKLTAKRHPSKRRGVTEKFRDTVHTRANNKVPGSTFFSGFMGQNKTLQRQKTIARLNKTRSKSSLTLQSTKAGGSSLNKISRKHISSAPILGIGTLSNPIEKYLNDSAKEDSNALNNSIGNLASTRPATAMR